MPDVGVTVSRAFRERSRIPAYLTDVKVCVRSLLVSSGANFGSDDINNAFRDMESRVVQADRELEVKMLGAPKSSGNLTSVPDIMRFSVLYRQLKDVPVLSEKIKKEYPGIDAFPQAIQEYYDKIHFVYSMLEDEEQRNKLCFDVANTIAARCVREDRAVRALIDGVKSLDSRVNQAQRRYTTLTNALKALRDKYFPWFRGDVEDIVREYEYIIQKSAEAEEGKGLDSQIKHYAQLIKDDMASIKNLKENINALTEKINNLKKYLEV